jgi:recombination protein RecA
MPTVSIGLDLMTNEGGYRPGAQVEWYGLEGTNKTTFALQQCQIAQAWAPDKAVAYFDTETAVDKYVAASRLGIDMGAFPDGTPKFFYYPEADTDATLEDVLDRIYDYAASGLFSLIVLDSVHATQTMFEQKADSVTNGGPIAGPALIMSKALKKVKSICRRTGTRVLYINQLRTKLIQTPVGMKGVEEPGGGLSLRYVATHRFRAKWTDKSTDGLSMLDIKGDKVKYGPPWEHVDIPVINGSGVDRQADLVIQATKHGIITKSGSWFSHNGSNIGQGIQKTADYLRLSPALFDQIYNELMTVALPPEVVAA